MPNFSPDHDQAAALATWHGGDDRHNMAMQLLIETGEISKLIHKAEFKPGHTLDPALLMEEQGDAYYYLLVLAAKYQMTVEDVRRGGGDIGRFIHSAADIARKHTIPYCLACMARSAATIWTMIEAEAAEMLWQDYDPAIDLRRWLVHFEALLIHTGIDRTAMVEANQQKLAGVDNHGWRAMSS